MRSTAIVADDGGLPCRRTVGDIFSVIDSNRPDRTIPDIARGVANITRLITVTQRTDGDVIDILWTSIEQFFAQLFLGAPEMFVKRRRANVE